MERQDKDLPFILQYENIAWYENGEVRILDRRQYPWKREFVTCHSYLEVRDAVRDMVTQSAGPYTASPMAMALAAWECRDKKESEQLEFLKEASNAISSARPTTKKRIEILTEKTYLVAEKAIKEGRRADYAIRDYVVDANNYRYSKIAKMASLLVDKIPEKGKIMTQCYGDTIVGMMLRELKRRNNEAKLFCPETRPYFQGARLTATLCYEMGFDTTVITDNMPSFVMANENIDIFTCAADVICLDGSVVNKVGTSGIAICANHYGVPVYITGAPDKDHKDKYSVKIEMRDPNYSLMAMGMKTAVPGVKGYYPAFDITPSSLITGIVTDIGIYKPEEVSGYFQDGGKGEY